MLQCLAPAFAQTAAAITPAGIAPLFTRVAASWTNQSPLTTAMTVMRAVAIAPASKPAGIALRVPVEKSTATPNGQRYPDEVLRVERWHTGPPVGFMKVGFSSGAGLLTPGEENNRGTNMHSYPHPMFPGLAQGVSQWAEAHKPDTIFKNPLTVRPDGFFLVSSDLSDDKTPFQLHAYATISRKPDSGGWLTPPETVSCASNFNNEKMTLEAWQANDYAEVKKRMAVYSQECLATVVAALPELLRD